MVDFDRIPKLLRRFSYSEEAILGFSYIYGCISRTLWSEETKDELHKRVALLPQVDINLEFEELIGSFNDGMINKIYDELVWRYRGEDIKVRRIQVNETIEPVYVYHFNNHKIILEDERNNDNLFNAEIITTNAMEKIGYYLQQVNFNYLDSFKAGVCAANLRAQADYKATAWSSSHIHRWLPLVFSEAATIAHKEKILEVENGYWEKTPLIQIPLQKFLNGLTFELGKTIWAYQSHILFNSQGIERIDINKMPVLEFMEECKVQAIEFYHKFPGACIELADKKLHWQSFPHLSDEYDEKENILSVISELIGYGHPVENLRDVHTLKALIIFGYFCALSETILFGRDKVSTH